MKRLTKTKNNWLTYSVKTTGLNSIVSDNINSWLIYDKQISSACLRCANPPCISFSRIETEVSFLDSPGNPNIDVCPVDAIHQNSVGLPEINHDKCISCDICLCRCPVRAIRYDKAGKLKVATFINAEVFTSCSLDTQKQNLSRLQNTDLKIHHTLDAKRLSKAIGEINQHCRSNTHMRNIIARNLLICLGLRAQSAVTGDTNMRLDLLFQFEEAIGISEVEFNAPVESPRDILDGFAVVSNRHGQKKPNLTALILLDEFPNHRSDFYRMIDDIKTVLAVEIKVISITSLLALIWSGIKYAGNIKPLEDFVISHKRPTISPQMRKYIGEKSMLQIAKKYLEPQK